MKRLEGQDRRSSQCPEVVLWRSVLEQALRDLDGSTQGTGLSEAENVVSWVGTVDFVRVCFNADLDPDAVEAEFRAMIERTKTDE